MSFLDDISRLELSKIDLYSVLLKHGSVLGSDELIDKYASEFDRLLSQSSSSGTEYYKCTAVDEGSHTWAGYKAVWDGEYYYFEELPTTGLIYTGVTPVVDKIYNANTTVTVEHLYSIDDSLMRYVIRAENARDKAIASEEVASVTEQLIVTDTEAVASDLAEIREYSNALDQIIG